MPADAIIAKDLTFRYDQLVAVDHLNFNVAVGEIIGFLGPNGAGKTTIVKLLTGQLQPTEGHATLLGIDVAKKPEKAQAKIGVCFEETNLYEQMNAIENLKLFARLFGIKGFDPGPLLARVGLKGREGDRVEGYSKGMKRRLMVARALVSKPDILFLDEPTDGLDPASSENIRDIVREERDRGVTVFLTTHDMVEADKLSDRVAFVDLGKIVALDTPHNLKQKYGRRALEVKIAGEDGRLETKEIVMDRTNTVEEILTLFGQEKIVTVHTQEATLEDIFIDITGRELTA